MTSNKINFQKHIVMTICLMTILFLQIIIIVFFGVQKNSYHIDEMYSFTLANYEGGFVIDAENVIDGWKSGAFYKDALSVSKEEAFDYNIPYTNQILDVHPPVYYFVLHTASSLCAGVFSKWIGIIPNIIFNVLTTLVLFWISKKMSDNEYVAVLCTFVWSLSNGAIESGVLIRMYALLTFFVISLVALHIKGAEEIHNSKHFSLHTLVLMFCCTLLGILTHYYYMIVCFFLCGIVTIYFLLVHNWSNLSRYVITELFALGAAIAFFPAMLTHIFAGYRGKEALELALTANGYADTLKTVISKMSNDLFNGLGEMLVLILVVSCILLIIKKCWMKEIKYVKAFVRKYECNKMVFVLAIVSLGYLVVISKISPYTSGRYYMCIYPLIVIVIVQGLSNIFLNKEKTKRLICLSALMFGIVITSYVRQEVSYTYSNCAVRNEQLQEYEGFPAIILSDKYEYTGDSWIYEYGKYSAIYRCTVNTGLQSLNNAVNSYDVSNGFLIYADQIEGSDEALLKKLNENIELEVFEKITDIRCRVFFCKLK